MIQRVQEKVPTSVGLRENSFYEDAFESIRLCLRNSRVMRRERERERVCVCPLGYESLSWSMRSEIFVGKEKKYI